MDQMWKQRAVIIRRDENGYGLTVFGDNPVSVQTIKKGGAAELAGIREGDVIVKVNGTLVEGMTHTEVVNLIKSAGAYVTLTVKPPGGDLAYPPTPTMPSVGFLGGNGGRPHHHHSSGDRVTAPLPVNQDVQLQMQGCKLRTLQAMRDKASADVEKLWKKYEATGHPQDMTEFEKAQQGLKKIESQMKSFRQSSPNLQLQAPVPFGQFAGGHHSVPFQPPPRHRNPLAGPIMTSPTYQNVNWMDEESNLPPPPLPPRSHPHHPQSDSPNSSNHSSFNNLSHGQNKVFNNTNNDHLLLKHNSFGSPGGQVSPQQTHHRTKSSPDPVSMQKALNEGSRRSDSFNDLNSSSSSSKKNSRSRTSGAYDSGDGNNVSPPGSPPPPYANSNAKNANKLSISSDQDNCTGSEHQNNSVSLSLLEKGISGALPSRSSQFSSVDIIAMEEDDPCLWPNEPIVPAITGFHGPYSSLSRLLEHNAHLAVFINYVIDNRRDPSSLLFYLITSFDVEEGNLKEMKRWGYEVHSTFTAPSAPLLVPHVDENIATEIDDALTHEVDKEELMKRVFRKARNKAKEEINKQLDEFCNKRTAGLGSMYGPPDNQLEESLHDKNKELRIVETYLCPRVEQFNMEVEKTMDGRTFAIMIATATIILKQFGLRNHSNMNSILERHGSFMSKEKSKSRFISKPKKVTHNGHHFVLQCYSSYTECNVCSKLLWGIGPQGQQCVDCNLNIHRSIDTYRTHNCINEIHDFCLGTNQKNKANDKFRRLKERIRPEKDPKKRISKKLDDNLWGSGSFGESDTAGEKPLSGSSSKNDRRPETLSEEFPFEDDEIEDIHPEPKKSSTAVGRSESCKERVQRKRETRERRKHSDPNLSKSSDVDLENQRQLSDANNSGSSSNSSLSARYLTSLESPSNSIRELEIVGRQNNSSSSLRGRDSETPETTVGHSEPYKPSPGWDGDSDIEIEQDPPDWTKNVPDETLAALDRLEKKRQEVLNELFHTERSHVRNLKVVDRLFHRHIRQQQLLPENLIQMLFANLEEMLEIHGRFNSTMKKLRMENPLVGEVGTVLLEMFDGESGENFRKAAATFCSKQQIGLELLRDKRRKDAKFHAFLIDAESDPVCRRLGIKDMIPMAMQRLTKYPLLFENLCNCTSPDTEEYKNIQRAVELSKEVLTFVNGAKKEAEDLERLCEIQRKLDKSAFDKGYDKTDPAVSEMRNMDFTKHRLIYEGPLMWRMTKSRREKSEMLEVQAVLLHDMIVILLKQDDRYVLKIHNLGFPGKADRMLAKPIIKLNNLHHRPVATDKRAFFLISTTSSNMYELVCSTAEERNVWFSHITKAAEDYKSRQESRRTENLQNSTPHSGTTASNIPSSIPPEIQDDKSGAEGEGEKDLQNQLLPPNSTPNVSKEPSPAPESTSSDPLPTPGSPPSGLAVGTKVARSASTGRRREGEFIQITQSSPLVDPSEVVVESRDVHFAESVLSPYEKLKRADAQIQKALEEKLLIATKLFHIPPTPPTDDAALFDSKDAKKLIVNCINNVDRLIAIVNSQKTSRDSAESQKEQQLIHSNLNAMLTHVLSEFERKDEELEVRRQELHRVREQNHGYQERLQNLSTPNPNHSRPANLQADHQSHDDPEIVRTTPSKPISSDPVATSNSEEDNNNTPPFSNHDSQCTDSAHQIADASLESGLNGGQHGKEELDNVEKNRDGPETELVFLATASTSEINASKDLVTLNSEEPQPTANVPDTEAKKNDGLPVTVTANGHNGEGGISDIEEDKGKVLNSPDST